MHTYAFFSFFVLYCDCVLSLSLSLSLSWINSAWHPRANLIRLGTLFVSGLLRLLIFPFPLFMFSSMMRRPIRTSLRTFLNVAFIWSAMWFCRTFSTLLYPMSFTLGDWNLFVRYLWGVPSCSYKSFTPICTISIPLYLNLLRYSEVHISLSLRILYLRYYTSRVTHPDYPTGKHLRTVSKDKLLSHFYETPSIWAKRQNTPCLGFVKGPRFLNTVMTFVLTPLFHYNYITEPRARFLLSLLEDLSIDFPSHFIIFIIDVYRDTTTYDKLNFPSAIIRILHNFSVPIPDSPYFTVMGAISAVSVWRSKAQLRLKRPQTEMTDPLASTIPSTPAPSSSGGGVTLEVIMAQLQCMDAHLDTLNDKLCQVNTHVGRRQACLGGFTASPSPSPNALADEDSDNGADEDEDVDEDASSSSDEEMTTS